MTPSDEPRPKNHEVENEMVCPPKEEHKPPRPKTQPKDADDEGSSTS